MQKILLLTLLMFVCWCRVYAATPVKVEGCVTDSQGNPLAYATVSVKGKTIGTTTDNKGNFSLYLPDSKEYTLTASFTGYAPAEASVSETERNIAISLTEDVMNINAVVVTGTRSPKLLKDVPVQTRVITSDEIRKVDATHIGDLLQAELPALEFSYSMNQQVSLNMQGFGGTSVLFLVDGERLAGETLDNVDYSRLNMDNVERVEIVKGAASSLYGSAAVGGVVNIITKEAVKPWAVKLNTRYGSHNAWRNGASILLRQGRINSVTDFQQVSQDTYSLGNSGDYTTLYGNKSYSLKERLGIRVSDRIGLIAKGGYYFRERNYSESVKNRYRDFSAGLKMNYDIDENNYLEVSYNFDQYDKSNYYTAKSKDIRNYSNIQNTARILYNHILDGGHTLTAGADGMTDYLMSYQFENDTDYRMYSADAFAQFDWKIADRLEAVGGLRLDYFSEIDEVRLSPKLALMYKPGDFALRGSYAGGFRAPTLKEMHMNFDMGGVFMIYGNPGLKSETSHNFILSGEYTRSRWSATASGYYNIVDNRISTVWNSGLYGMEYMNTRKVNIAGADAGFTMKLTNGLNGTVSYAYTKEFLKRGETSTSDARPHTAVGRLSYGRDWKNYGFNVLISGRYMSPVDTHTLTASSSYTEYAPVHYPGYTMWKLIASQSFGRGFTLTATVDNLFNYKPDFFYFNSPTTYGTMFSVGLSINIEEIVKKR